MLELNGVGESFTLGGRNVVVVCAEVFGGVLRYHPSTQWFAHSELHFIIIKGTIEVCIDRHCRGCVALMEEIESDLSLR